MEQQGTFFAEKELQKMFGVAFDDWLDYGVRLKRTEGKGDWFKSQHSWAIGDWLLAGKTKWGITKTRVEAERIFRSLKWGRLKNIMGTAKAFPKSRRRDFLYFSHHERVKKFEPERQDEWLDRCIKERWTFKGLDKALKGEERGPKARREMAEQLADWRATRKGEFPLRINTVMVYLDPTSSAIVQYLFETEKETHSQEKVENLLFWLAVKGIEQLGWMPKVKEFVAHRRVRLKARREESDQIHAAWKVMMDAKEKFIHGLPKDLNYSEYISRLRDWEAAWEKKHSGTSNQDLKSSVELDNQGQ